MKGQVIVVLILSLVWAAGFAQVNLVGNGNFEKDEDGNGVPDFWATAGAEHVKQQLMRDIGREGKGVSAKLVCTEFGDGTPASHAMVCQVGVVSIKRDKWYRLTFWARGKGIKAGVVQVALVNMQMWENAGLQEGFVVKDAWQRFETVFQGTQDLPAQSSRLQFWFQSTGTLWLDEVEIVEIEIKPQRHPQLPTEGVVNFIPNSSFECHIAGWGSYSPDVRTWAGNLYQLVGELDETTAAHGKHSLRIHLSQQTLPTVFFDYFDPVRQPLACILAAHQGWVPMHQGETYTLSVSLKADKSDVIGVLLIRQANGRNLRKDFPLTVDWQRYSFTFTAETGFAWVAVGLDLGASKVDAATVWVDAVQLERGTQGTPYQTRLPVEVLAMTAAEGNIFVSKENRGEIPLQLHAFNNTASPQEAKLAISVTDFFDAKVLRQTVSLLVPAHNETMKTVRLPVRRFGFYRISVAQMAQDKILYQQQLRCAIIKPRLGGDSRFGMNHAYPWAFLLRLAHQAGILWWRDWSIQWRTVQGEQDAPFDFREPDLQIDRVLKEGGKVLVLFPFPSSHWASTADEASVEKVARSDYERRLIALAFKPSDEKAFSQYIAESVRHYKSRIQAYHFLNEPLYTTYALPARLGHTLDDYLHLLRIAYRRIKEEQPKAIVVGGIGIWADNKWTKEFVEAGGLQFVDVLDLHLYPKGSPEAFGESLGQLWGRMRERGEGKPIWVTELGCYGDDEPAITPFVFGDAAMRQALHKSEREAAEWLIKFATIFFANGGEKIFLHAGTCGEINGVDAGGVFFAYGGAPRKIYTTVAAMANLLPSEAKFERTGGLGNKVTAYWFRTTKGRIAVIWSADGEPHRVSVPAGTQALDIMGNPIAGSTVTITETPIYLVYR